MSGGLEDCFGPNDRGDREGRLPIKSGGPDASATCVADVKKPGQTRGRHSPVRDRGASFRATDVVRAEPSRRLAVSAREGRRCDVHWNRCQFDLGQYDLEQYDLEQYDLEQYESGRDSLPDGYSGRPS